MDKTTHQEWSIPEEKSKPYYDAFLALMNQVDSAFYTLDHQIPRIDQYNDSLSQAISEIGSAVKPLIIHKPISLTEHATVPTNISLIFFLGGKITLGDHNLTINGPMTAPVSQIFDDSGAGSVSFGAGYVKEVYAEYWGGKADNGTTDNHDPIQSALNAFSIVKAGSIGTYETSKNIDLNTGNKFLADSHASILKLEDNGATATSDYLLKVRDKTDIEIRGWTFDDNKDNQTVNHDILVIQDTCSDILVERCIFKNAEDRAIRLQTDTGDTITRIQIRYNRFTSIEEAAIGIDNSDSPYEANRGTVSELEISHNESDADYGFRFVGLEDSIISENIISYSGTAGIEGVGGKNLKLVISNNKITGTGADCRGVSIGFYADGGGQINISGNVIRGNGNQDGIELVTKPTSTGNVTVESVNVLGNTIDNHTNGIIFGHNTVAAKTSYIKGFSFVGNVIKGVTYGIKTTYNGTAAGEFEDGTIFGNVIEASAIGIMVRDYDSSGQKAMAFSIMGNVVNGATEGLEIQAYQGGGPHTVSGNIAHGGTYGFVFRTDSNPIRSSGNVGYSNTDDVYQSAGNWLIEDTVSVVGKLTAGIADAFAFTWQNPHGEEIIVHKVIIRLSVAGGTAGSLLNVGTAANATTESDNLIDGVDLNAVTIYDNHEDKGDNGKTRQKVDEKGGATDWITGRITVENASDLQGKYYIYYSIVPKMA